VRNAKNKMTTDTGSLSQEHIFLRKSSYDAEGVLAYYISVINFLNRTLRHRGLILMWGLTSMWGLISEALNWAHRPAETKKVPSTIPITYPFLRIEDLNSPTAKHNAMVKQKHSKGIAAAAAATASQDSITDPRFASFTTDPRFRLPSKKYTRTKIDKRFSRMLKDDDFANTAKVDRYGRKLSNTAKKEALKRLYQPEEDEESAGEMDESGEEDEVVERELKRFGDKRYDPARGGGFSSSDDDEDEEDEDDGGVEIEAIAEFPDMQTEQSAVPMGEVTSRIAVVNLDWDNIRAVDLMAVFSSFLRGAGRIEKVAVYKSEFGRERMEREEMEGPPREIFAKKVRPEEEEEETDSEDESDVDRDEEEDEDEDEKIKKDLLKEDDGQDFNSAALRQYQLERLRYYYAVIVCSDKETANHIYESTDGTEYLSSANFFDLRFIPDDVDFDEKPRDECTSVPTGYKPTEFVTDALQHSKVKLTWDAEDTERKEVIKRAFSGSRAEIGENDLRAYLGSDSSEDEDDETNPEETTDAPKLTKKELARQKMRAALGLPDEPTSTSKADKSRPVGDMEITFTAGLSSKAKGGVFENEPIKEETTAEAYIRKEKERKTRRREKAKALREGRDPAADHESATAKDISPPPQEQPTFDDPFFTTDEAAQAKVAKTLHKEERRKKREAKAAEAATLASQRAELELLMADNSTIAPSDRLDHFDINEIARAEKEAQKKSKKRQRSRKGKGDIATHGDEGEGKRGGLQSGFKMDVADPRFAAVFERHEFAIDPSNPRFKGTEGMRKLLEAGRRKRKAGGGDDVDVGEGKSGKKTVGGETEVGDLKELVESVKKKAKR
jgi:hypothetical protein